MPSTCARSQPAHAVAIRQTAGPLPQEQPCLAGLLAEHFAELPGPIMHGDLAVREEALRQAQGVRMGGRLLPAAIFARWHAP